MTGGRARPSATAAGQPRDGPLLGQHNRWASARCEKETAGGPRWAARSSWATRAGDGLQR
jgi:hypothetical protein